MLKPNTGIAVVNLKRHRISTRFRKLGVWNKSRREVFVCVASSSSLMVVLTTSMVSASPEFFTPFLHATLLSSCKPFWGLLVTISHLADSDSHLVGIRKKNIGTDITSWRWCQFRNVNARPVITILPKLEAHNIKVVIKALNLGLVHSIMRKTLFMYMSETQAPFRK